MFNFNNATLFKKSRQKIWRCKNPFLILRQLFINLKQNNNEKTVFIYSCFTIDSSLNILNDGVINMRQNEDFSVPVGALLNISEGQVNNY